MADTYAIIESGGKQYRAEKGAVLEVDRLPGEEGETVALRPVMFRSADDVVMDGSELEKVKVEARIAGHHRGKKLRVFKYKKKKGYRRTQGHRSELTQLEVTGVEKLSRKPAKKQADAKKQPTKQPAKKQPAKKTDKEA